MQILKAFLNIQKFPKNPNFHEKKIMSTHRLGMTLLSKGEFLYVRAIRMAVNEVDEAMQNRYTGTYGNPRGIMVCLNMRDCLLRLVSVRGQCKLFFNTKIADNIAHRIEDGERPVVFGVKCDSVYPVILNVMARLMSEALGPGTLLGYSLLDRERLRQQKFGHTNEIMPAFREPRPLERRSPLKKEIIRNTRGTMLAEKAAQQAVKREELMSMIESMTQVKVKE